MAMRSILIIEDKILIDAYYHFLALDATNSENF
jgi:hypothetical protein